MSEIENYISITEYAKMHNLDASTIRQKCARGGFKTAKKIGRNWLIDKNEELEDLRVKSGKYKNWRKNNKL